MTTIEKALAYFKMEDIEAFQENGRIFVVLNRDNYIDISQDEIEYRAELYDEQTEL